MSQAIELLPSHVPFHELDCVGLRLVLETLAVSAAHESGAPCRVRWELKQELDDQLEALLLEMAREAFALAAEGLSLRLWQKSGLIHFDVHYDVNDDPSFAAMLFARMAELSAPFDGRLRMESAAAEGALLRLVIPCRLERV